jgi:hypothetical protein
VHLQETDSTINFLIIVCDPGRVLDSGGKTPIMKSGSGGFNGENCGWADDRVRMMVLPGKTAKQRQSKRFLDNFHYFLGFK